MRIKSLKQKFNQLDDELKQNMNSKNKSIKTKTKTYIEKNNDMILDLTNLIHLYNNSNKNNIKNKDSYMYLGMIDEEKWLFLAKQYIKRTYYTQQKIIRFCNSYKKQHGKQPYIHISKTILDIHNLQDIQKPQSYFRNKFYFNPNGLWFSIGTEWLKKYGFLLLQNTNPKHLDVLYDRWVPKYIYVIEMIHGNENIISLNNCNDIARITEKFKMNKPSSVAHYLDWKQIYKSYSGMTIPKYSSLLNCCSACKNFRFGLEWDGMEITLKNYY